MKKFVSVLLLVAMLLALSSCTQATPTVTSEPATSAPATSAPVEEVATIAPTSSAAEETTPAGQDQLSATVTAKKPCKIGINNFGQANFFARIGKASLTDELQKSGCEVVATVTADVSSRTAAIEDMISQQVDAIIIEEGDVNEVAPALKEAKKAGIIIGSMDGGTGDFVDIYVASDNTKLGGEIAKKMVEVIGGKGNIVEIINDAGSMIRARKDAMHEVISAYPDIKIINSMVYSWPDFYPDVKNKIESLLQANPNPGDIVAVYATFDGAGIAAADAIREAGLQKSIIVVGIDGDPDAYAEMRKPDSPFVATAAQDPDTIARITVRGVVTLLNGDQLSDKVFYVPGIIITKDNIPPE